MYNIQNESRVASYNFLSLQNHQFCLERRERKKCREREKVKGANKFFLHYTLIFRTDFINHLLLLGIIFPDLFHFMQMQTIELFVFIVLLLINFKQKKTRHFECRVAIVN